MHRTRTGVLAATMLLAIAAAPATTGASLAGTSLTASSPDAIPTVVVAVADSGVNPYHEVYRRPDLTTHPCQWVAGFDDCSVEPLQLSLGQHETTAEALEADRDVWNSVVPGRWYWIPGTNIIGAVCDPDVHGETCIVDDDGHGTGTTSSVLAEHPDALLLVHDGNGTAAALSSAPVQPDVQSHSWGGAVPIHPALHPVLDAAAGSSFEAHNGFGPATLFFLSAGNLAPLPTTISDNHIPGHVQVVGGGFPGHATTSSWSMADFASWYCRPVARHDASHGSRELCGTSFATPTAAGAASAALGSLRSAARSTARSTPDLVSPGVSREAFIAALRSAATYEPDARYTSTDALEGVEFPIPPGTEHVFWGYGWLDAGVVPSIVACAAEGDCPGKSSAATAWNDARQELRAQQESRWP